MNKKVSNSTMKKRIFSLSAGVFMVLLICVLYGSFFVSAHEDTDDTDTVYKYYKSIEIQPGDTYVTLSQDRFGQKFSLRIPLPEVAP